MSKENNLTDFLTDVADAIREKKGTTDKINPQNFSDEIKSISTSIWTGHADVEGLKAIGWTDEDIAYYQEHGVNWMAEDDEYHKVSDDNKALYGVLTADNIQEYKDRIVYLPKIDTSEKTVISDLFKDCTRLVFIPKIDTSKATAGNELFANCYCLVGTHPLDLRKMQNFQSLFYNAYSIKSIDITFNYINLTQYMFSGCNSLEKLSLNLEIPSVSMVGLFARCSSLRIIPPLKTERLENTASMFSQCWNVVKIPLMNMSKVTPASKASNMFNECYSLVDVLLQSLTISIDFKYSALLSKGSLMYMINNEIATEPIVITLHADAYARLAEDPDIVEALTNHPLVSLATV